MKTKIIFFSIFLVLLSTTIYSQKQTPSTFVQSFYKFHRARSGSFNANELSLLKKWFTPQLNELLQNELKREEEFIKQNPKEKPHWGDGFSFAPNEDGYINGKITKNTLKVGSFTIRKSIALVTVKFYLNKVWGGNLVDTYKIELVKNNNGWLINDLIYSDGSRLTKDLKRNNYY